MAIVYPYGNCVVSDDSFDANDEKSIREYVKEFQDNGLSARVHREHLLLGEIGRLRAELREAKGFVKTDGR